MAIFTGGGTVSVLCLSLIGLELRPTRSQHANDCTSGFGLAISGRHQANATVSGYELVLKVGEHGAAVGPWSKYPKIGVDMGQISRFNAENIH